MSSLGEKGVARGTPKRSVLCLWNVNVPPHSVFRRRTQECGFICHAMDDPRGQRPDKLDLGRAYQDPVFWPERLNLDTLRAGQCFPFVTGQVLVIDGGYVAPLREDPPSPVAAALFASAASG